MQVRCNIDTHSTRFASTGCCLCRRCAHSEPMTLALQLHVLLAGSSVGDNTLTFESSITGSATAVNSAG